jgi:hypothetical protein
MIKKIAFVCLMFFGTAIVAGTGKCFAEEATNGLVAWWKFDEGSGTVAHDSVGDNDGTIYGATWTGGKINGALSFDGVDDYIDVGDESSLNFGATDSFSIAVWVKSGTNEQAQIVSKRRFDDDGYGCEGYCFKIHQNKLYFAIEDADGHAPDIFGETVVTKNEWHRVAAVRDVSTGKLYLYLDGKLDAKPVSDSTTSTLSSSQSFWIGRLSYYDLYFDGVIDDVRIYNYALYQSKDWPKSTINGAIVDYNDGNTVAITAGNGECNGHYWEITSTMLHDMASLTTAEGYHYVYIDDSNSDYPVPTIIDSTAEPAWSDSKLGWYRGNNRCIGVVWNPSGSATITSFTVNRDLKYYVGGVIKELLINGSPDGQWHTLEATAYLPVNAIGAFLHSDNSDANGYKVNVCLKPYEALSDWSPIMFKASKYVWAAEWLSIKRGASRNLAWAGFDWNDNCFCVRLVGYEIER